MMTEHINDLDAAQRIDDRQRIVRWNEGPNYPRPPEPAHAASEIDDDEPGVSPSWIAMTRTELAKFTAPAWVAVAIVAAMLAAHFWPR